MWRYCDEARPAATPTDAAHLAFGWAMFFVFFFGLLLLGLVGWLIENSAS